MLLCFGIVTQLRCIFLTGTIHAFNVYMYTLLEDMPPESMTDIDAFAITATMWGMLDLMMDRKEKINSVNLREDQFRQNL